MDQNSGTGSTLLVKAGMLDPPERLQEVTGVLWVLVGTDGPLPIGTKNGHCARRREMTSIGPSART